MFKSKKSINPNATDTVIGEGTVIEGKIRSTASLRIEGSLTGDIQCDGDVTIGENGMIKSNITAREVIIAGKVYGNVTAKGKISITSKGHLYGNANSLSLIIGEGGIFQGMSRIETKGNSDAVAMNAEELPIEKPSAPISSHTNEAPPLSASKTIIF